MEKIKAYLKRLTTPRLLSPQEGIHFWQEKILLNLILGGVVLGFVAWCPSVALSIREQLWVVAFLDTLMLLWVLALFLLPTLSYRFRARSILFLSYILGLVLILTLGPFGAGPVWLFFFPILTGVLQGARPAAWALVVNGITLIVLGILIHLDMTDLMARLNIKAWHLTPENAMEKWGVICVNFLFLNLLATLSVTTILKGLHTSLQELKRSDFKHRQIFENILDIYFETALDGTILEVSPSVEQISHYTQEELRGTSFAKIHKDPGQRERILQRLVTTGHIQNEEVQLVDKTGEVLLCSINARLLRDTTDAPGKIIGIFRDITQQQDLAKMKTDLEERLNRSQKMEALGLLAGGVAHDLNNVLAGLVTYPNLLLMKLPKNSPLAKPLNLIQSSGQLAAEIVQDLLTLSRRGKIIREKINLNEIVENFLSTMECERLLSFHPHVRVEKALSAESPFLNGSRIHLVKTLMNLITNAAEAQVEKGVITISTLNLTLDTPVKGYDTIQPGDYIVLGVQDQGQGIDSQDLKQIFEPFFTRKIMGRSGSGLGMTVVWGTIQDHDGYIDVNSQLGKGTRFDLYFPLSPER